MRTLTIPLVFASLLACRLCLAQAGTPAEDFKPSSLNQPGKQYPQVNSEGRVKARVVAPEAQNVTFEFLGGGKYPMTKDDDGVWTVVTRPQDEGFHYYQLVINGGGVPDPGTLYFFGGNRWGSAVEVPAHDQDFYALNNVPHGQLQETLYYSESTDAVLRCFVYTPPGYDQDPSKRYPVLYLQHGGGEDETGWGRQGHAALIMDNLIARGKARPFIIVMADSYVPGSSPFGGGATPNVTGRQYSLRLPGFRGRSFSFEAFGRVLIDELIPFIDANFRTLTDQPHRAMAGLSMGGMQTRSITLANLDKFSHIGIFSGGSISTSDIPDMDTFKEKVKVVFVSYGSRENGATGKANIEALQQTGIRSLYYESPNTAHEWQTWRRSLYRFAALLFEDQPLPPPFVQSMARPQPVRAAMAAVAAPTTAAAPASASATAASTRGIIRIKAGSSEPVTDAEGNVWMADQGFVGGLTIARPTIKIANTKSPDLYQAERYSMESFSWSVPNGDYLVNLHFAETFEGIYGPGERVFSFNVQSKEFKDFDVWVKAGGPLKAYVETIPVKVTDGEIKITFTPKVENPQICAIEIIPTGIDEDNIGASTSAAAAVVPDASSATTPPFPTPLQWKSSGVLVKPVSDQTHKIVSVKDPTVVHYNDLWHIYATVYSTSARTWNMVYLNFKDWSEAPNAKLHFLDQNPGLKGYHCAPHVFYFRPHKKWYLIFQSQQPQYCTTDDLSKPETWTRPQDFFDGKPDGAPRLWIDYHVICDDTHAYLFFTGDNGRFYRSRTRIEDFPKGMSNPEIAIEGNRGNLFEGSITYKIKGSDSYLTLVEAMSPARYYRAWISDRLDGEWTPVPNADRWKAPFAGINNVTFQEGVAPWTRDISHGELLRDGYDERMVIDPNNLRFLFQGRAQDSGGRYELLPYQLGLLTAEPAGG